MISISLLSKSFGNHTVLQDVNLEVNSGSIHGIVGANGSGKTTLFRCVSGLESYEGKINIPEFEGQKTIGFLPTNPPILSKITGSEYLRLLTLARAIDIKDFAAKNIFDLPLKEFVENYSTGMKKKLAITGLLLQNNEIFILDEPFNGLDYPSCALLIEILHELKRKNKTIILSSHIFSTLSDTCDAIHFLQDGVIKKSAEKEDFEAIETYLKKELVGNKIQQLNL